MKYGRFSNDASEYVITRADTPRPWINVVYNEVYGVYVSQNGFGFSFYRDWEGVKITYVDIVGYVPTYPQTGKFIYLRDQDSGKAWANVPMHQPMRGYTGFRCTHGQGYTTISASRNGIQTRLEIFVPRGSDPIEIWNVTLQNTTSRHRRIKAFPFQQWQLTAPSGITDTLTYTRASWRDDLGAIVARMTNPTSPFMYDAFMAADFQPEQHECSYDKFIGVYGRLDEPAAVLAGECTNSPASGERMVGVLARTFELPPGGSVSFRIITGLSMQDGDVARLKGKYLPDAGAAGALDEVKGFWRTVRETITCKTPEPAIDISANSWVKWQNFHTTRHARGGYRGYRDVLQDIMGIAPLDPAFTRHWLLEVLGYENSTGLCPRGWNPVSGRLDNRQYRDSPCWIPLTLSAYLRETGQMSLLDEQVRYADAGQASVFDHTMLAMRRLFADRGSDGLCLIGDGDWNDSLNEVALEGRGQSIWLTIAAVYAMRVLEEIARAGGRYNEADELKTMSAELSDQVNLTGWDGKWYAYAINDHGEPVGSDRSSEGKIHLNAQTWAIFAGVAKGERLKQVLDTIDNTLDTRWGPVLIHPPYTRYVRGIGKVSGKNPGMAENGPVYSHGIAFKMLADLAIGRGDKAFESYMKLCPAAADKDPDVFLGEPFAAHRYLIGPGCPERFGASPYSHNTGWPAWTFPLIFEWMLGVRPWFDGLIIDPCVPGAWKKFEVVRPFRGAVYRVRVRNPRGVQRGVQSIKLDGRKIDGNKLPVLADGEHVVDVLMGRPIDTGPIRT